MRIALLLVFAVWPALAQTNPVAPASGTETFQTPTNHASSPALSPTLSVSQRYEKVRLDCIQSRRIICGKIVKVLPDGLVVESGYLDLMRSPLGESWLIPGTVTSVR